VISSWKCLVYTVFVTLGIYSLVNETHWLWNVFEYIKPYADNRIPWKIDLWYKMETSFYLYSMVSIFFEPKMKDRRLMLLHHLSTSTLLIVSYLNGYTKFGAAVMLLHDISDPLMEAAKMANYCGIKRVENQFVIVIFIN